MVGETGTWLGCSKLNYAKFEFRYKSLKSKFSLIHFDYTLRTGCFKNNKENYPRKYF